MRTKFILAGILLVGVGYQSYAQESFPTIQFGGRVHGDTTYFSNDKYQYQDGSELRRGRLYVRGNLSEDWEYRIQTEFSDDDPELKDGYVRYNGFENSRIILGNFKQFSSLEFLTSSNNITFTERAMVNSLVTGRRVGIGYQRWDDRYSLGVSAYTNEANDNVRGNGIGGRFVYRPALQGDQLLHLGINYAREEDDDDTVRFRARPDSHQDSHRIVNTGSIADVDALERAGLELAYVNNRFSAQGEYVSHDLKRDIGPDLTFTGYYIYASYFLTDDSRPYSRSNGAFDTLTPTSDSGAWEIGLRLSNLDLNDEGIGGGQADTVTFGVNYYMNRNVRLTANYIMADSDRLAGDDDPDALQLRFRITF